MPRSPQDGVRGDAGFWARRHDQARSSLVRAQDRKNYVAWETVDGVTERVMMKLRASFCRLLAVLTMLEACCSFAQTVAPPATETAAQKAMDRDLLEVTIPRVEQLFRTHKYTVTEVVHWYLARIEKYNGIYRALQNLDAPGAL